MLDSKKPRFTFGKASIFITVCLICQLSFSQWQQTSGTPEGSGITDMAISDIASGEFVVTTGSINGGQTGGIRRTYDGGNNWVNVFDCYIARTVVRSVLNTGQEVLYASCWQYPVSNEGIYRSFSNGSYWTPIYNFPSTGNNIFAINVSPNDTIIYAGTRTGILRSTDNGVSFSFSNSGIPANSWVWDIAVDSSGIVAAATTNGLFISTNSGSSWQQTSGVPAGDTVTSLVFAGFASDANSTNEKLFAGTDDGKVLIAGNETFYLAIVVANLIDPNIQFEKGYSVRHDLETFDRVFFTGRPKTNQGGGGVYQSSNSGQSFTQMNNGLPLNPNVSSIIGLPGTNSKELAIGFFNNTNNGGQVYKQTIPIGIIQISTQIPDGFSLSQNYPNPFNPATNIEFSVPKSSFVKLVIFDMLGRETAVIVNQKLTAGKYKTDWNGSAYASGVYFYKLITNGYSETKKMLLIK